MNLEDYQDDQDLADVFRKSMGNLDDFVAARIYFDNLNKKDVAACLRGFAANITDVVAPDLSQYILSSKC